MGKIFEKVKESLDVMEAQSDSYKHVKNFEYGNVHHIPINKIKSSPNKVRKSINRDDISHMAENIKKFGIFQPIEINENNEVILGHRRFEAAKLAFLEYVPCIIKESSQVRETEKQIISDIHTKHLTVIERAKAFKALMEINDITKYGLAKYLNLSHNLVCRTLSILEANKTTISLIEDGKISQKKAAMVLYRLKDKSLEDFVMKEIIRKKMSIEQAGNFISELNNPKLFKKHFLTRMKAFETSIKEFEKKVKEIPMGEEDKKDIKDTLERVNKIIDENSKKI